ncbi:MAG TPA: UDP-N-acetylglucosamine 2-epimerase (non-hydrolyzing) [Chitinophagaceae bacterium]|nr:UDP-N-acetylglucosamine 2-epimerase (non-hydrolyzing) [Chitinophagaceae bacterium]
MKLLSIAGARPQLVKLSAFSRELRSYPQIQEIILHTGQHWEDNMSGVFFRELGIPDPDFQLGIHDLPHGAMTGRMLEGIESVLKEVKPDMVLVYGDTNSTLAGALATKKMHIPLAHAEAGLRIHDLRMPEEINRVLTDRISDLLFCPTSRAMVNLDLEGFGRFPAQVFWTGDLMWDALTYYSARFNNSDSSAKPGSPFVLCTIHREENILDIPRLTGILDALSGIQSRARVVFPAHPRTAEILHNLAPGLPFPVTGPLGYLDMLHLVSQCTMVITDSGGLQKEAFFFHKPCIALREQTEWTELVQCGCNIPAGADSGKILKAFDIFQAGRSIPMEHFYGDGHAARQMINHILNYTAC